MPTSSRSPARRALWLASACLLLLLVGPASAGETKVFDAHNFKWTIPDDWQFHEVGAEGQASGYVVRAVGGTTRSYVMADVRIKTTEGLSISEISQEVKDWATGTLGKVEGSRSLKGTLSGIEGSQVVVKGSDKNDVPVLIRAYSIEKGGKFHQLIMRFVGGAESSMGSEADEARRGYRLLKGAGPQEPAIRDDTQGGEEDLPEMTDWPPEGPKREGRTLIFAHHNLKWTMPEGSMFEWRQPIEDESTDPEKGKIHLLVAAAAQRPRKTKKDTEPQANVATVLLLAGNAQPGYDPNRAVESQGLQEFIGQNFFDKVEYNRLKVSTDIDFGNHKGARISLAGTKENQVVYTVWYLTGLKGKEYQWRIFVRGGREGFEVFKGDILKLMKTVEFLDTEEWVKGPVAIPAIGMFGQERGYAFGEEKSGTTMGFDWEKPAELHVINHEQERTGPNFRLAWETRSEDKQKYLYFDVHTMRKQAGARNPLEQIVKQRESSWKEHADSPSTIKKGKTPWFKSKWAKGKGLGYEFKGYAGDTPFVEKGYVVEYKKTIYWVRMQFGGDGAEKAFSKLVKKLKKAVKMKG